MCRLRSPIHVDTALRLPVAMLTIMLLVGSSCTQAPRGDQNSPSDASTSMDVNSSPVVLPDESPGPAAGLASPDTVSTDTKVDNRQTDTDCLPFVGWSGREIDINSGDLRGVVPMPDGSSKHGIYESYLSREVRRLGIPIPAERKWRLFMAGGGSRGVCGLPVYSHLGTPVRLLLEALDEARAADDERRSVLERFMMSLRTSTAFQAADTGFTLYVEVADRHGLRLAFREDYAEKFRRDIPQPRSEQPQLQSK